MPFQKGHKGINQWTNYNSLVKKYPDEYNSWIKMKTRCYNSKVHNYKRYGGRGIKVCDRWILPYPEGFQNFINDMGKKPQKEYTIDRIDNDGNYEPSNCRWADKHTQANNK